MICGTSSFYTRHYDAFCRRAFGRFLHHTPAVVLTRDRQNNSGLRRVWWYSCKEENINPRKATRLPLLFALDSKLGIADGFVYAPDCKKVRRSDGSSTDPNIGMVYCGGDFSDSSFDGSVDGFGSGDSSFGRRHLQAATPAPAAVAIQVVAAAAAQAGIDSRRRRFPPGVVRLQPDKGVVIIDQLTPDGSRSCP